MIFFCVFLFISTLEISTDWKTNDNSGNFCSCLELESPFAMNIEQDCLVQIAEICIIQTMKEQVVSSQLQFKQNFPIT